MALDSTPDTLDELVTPLLRLDAAGAIVEANQAAGRWLGVGRRRLLGTPAAALERDTQALAQALQQTLDAPLRLRRVALAFPGSDELHFADLWLVSRGPACDPRGHGRTPRPASPEGGRWSGQAVGPLVPDQAVADPRLSP